MILTYRMVLGAKAPARRRLARALGLDPRATVAQIVAAANEHHMNGAR